MIKASEARELLYEKFSKFFEEISHKIKTAAERGESTIEILIKGDSNLHIYSEYFRKNGYEVTFHIFDTRENTYMMKIIW